MNRIWTKRPLAAAVLIATTSLAASVSAVAAEEWDEMNVLIEINATDGDAGFHALLDGLPWEFVRLHDPDGNKLFNAKPSNSLKDQGLTENFFESAEPLCDPDDAEAEGEDAVSLAEFLERFPEGDYTFVGRSSEKERLLGDAELTYDIPAAPDIEAIEEMAFEFDPDDPDTTPVIMMWEPNALCARFFVWLKWAMPSTQQLDQQAPSIALEPSRIPNLDLAALFSDDHEARAALVRRIEAACHDPGFFYVHNTCVPDQVIQSALDAGEQFFSAPDDSPVKQGVHNRLADEMKGWGPMFGEPAYQKGTVAHVESFDIGQQLTAGEYASLGITPNIWPELPGFRANVLAYYDGVTRLGRAISEVISELLGMERNFINDHSGPQAPRTMRMLHYPANTAPPEEGNVGIAAHTDFECFTIMNQTAAGLELTNVEGQWCQAPSDIGTFTIILGDMTERFSNGHFKATGHRVVNTQWTRYSLILFFAVDGGYEVAPLPQFVSEDNPARYEPVTQDQHIDEELQRAASNG